MADNFGSPELLSEEEGNGWRPEKGAPKVDALKGSLLRAHGLPTLLQLHLKRFNYDWKIDQMTKINTRFTFPKELNLADICSDIGKDELSSAMYDLQSVVIHVGEYGSGHYYAYVRPDIAKNTWYRFNDDKVTKVSFKEVIADAYGEKVRSRPAKKEKVQRRRRFGFPCPFSPFGNSLGWGGPTSNAYMIQYVRRDDIPKLYSEN